MSQQSLDAYIADIKRGLLGCQSALDHTRNHAAGLVDEARQVANDPAAALAEMGEAEFLALVRRLAAITFAIGAHERELFRLHAAEHLRRGGSLDDLRGGIQ